MKKALFILIAAVLLLGLTACSSRGKEDHAVKNTAEVASVEGASSYKIGVIVYSSTDEEVLAFRDYLENYIAGVFPAISFVYSDSISTEEEELAFMQKACDEGVDGFLSFLSLDLAREVELCEKNQVYYMLASGTVADEMFRKVEDNPWFIGAVGPGTELEYQAGAGMAELFAGQKSADEYFILSGGASLGNEMHLSRVKGMLDTLQKEYGVTFDQTSEEIAGSDKPVHISAGKLTVCVTPGYISREDALKAAVKEYEKDRFDVVLSVIPIADMAKVVKGAKLGVVDCYSERNLQLFNSGQLAYIEGKYNSIIGPSFAAMYNAITGYADDFRQDGKAFKAVQGFWSSADRKDYEEKYAMCSSVVTNAYNYEDLGKVCKVYNPDADLDDLIDLIRAYSYEDALKRRGKTVE